MHLLARLHRTKGIGCPFDVVKRWEKKNPGVCSDMQTPGFFGCLTLRAVLNCF